MYMPFMKNKSSSSSTKTTSSLMFQETINVPGNYNNCGLYALVLALKLVVKEKQQAWPTAIPAEIKGIDEAILRTDSNMPLAAQQSQLAKIDPMLRSELSEAFKIDPIYKKHREDNFIALCAEYVKKNKKNQEADMEAFLNSNLSFLDNFFDAWRSYSTEKLTHNLDSEEICSIIFSLNISEEDVAKCYNEIKAVFAFEEKANFSYKEALAKLFSSYYTDQDNALHRNIQLRKLFRAAWQRVLVTDASEQARGQLEHVAVSYFQDQYCQSLRNSSKDDFFQIMHLCAHLEDSTLTQGKINIADKNIIQHTELSLFAKLKLYDHWEPIYNRYCQYVAKHGVMLSADELSCLAKRWLIKLEILFPNGNIASMGSETASAITIRLCNPGLYHWQVKFGTELPISNNSKSIPPLTNIGTSNSTPSISTDKKADLSNETTIQKHLRLKKNDIQTLLRLHEQLCLFSKLAEEKPYRAEALLQTLQQIGYDSNSIEWDEENPKCIRNLYAIKAGKYENKDGIDFDQLAYLNKKSLYADDYTDTRLRDALFAAAFQDICTDIKLLNNKICHIIQNQSQEILSVLNPQDAKICNDLIAAKKIEFGPALKSITLFTGVLNDRRCINRIIMELPLNGLSKEDLINSKIKRYYFARILTITGELTKNLSAITKLDKKLRSLLTAIAKFRDAIKVNPHIVSQENNKKFLSFYDFFQTHKTELLQLFKFILTCLKDNISWDECRQLQNDNSPINRGLQTLNINLETLNTTAREIRKPKKVSSSVLLNTVSEAQSTETKAQKKENKEVKIDSYLKGLVNLYQVELKYNEKNEGKKTENSKNKEERLKKTAELKNKYKEAWQILPDENKNSYPDPDDREAILKMVAPSALPQPKKPAKKVEQQSIETIAKPPKSTNTDEKSTVPKSKSGTDKLINNIIKEIKFQNELLRRIKMYGSNQEIEYAQAQSIGFLGQYIKDLRKADKNINHFQQYCSQEWHMSMTKTMQVRHKVVSHGILNEEFGLVSKVVNEEIVPWLEDAEAVITINECADFFKDLKANNHWNRFNLEFCDFVSKLANHVGLAYTRLDQLTKAEELFTLSISLLDDNYAKTRVMHNLADIYRLQKQYRKVLPLMQSIVTIRETCLGSTSPKVAETLNNLGITYSYLGEPKSAIIAYEKALRINLYNGVESSACYLNLANAYADEQLFVQALNLYERALYAADGDVEAVLITLLSISTFYLQKNQFSAAELCLQKANQFYEENIGLFKKALGDRHVLSKAALLATFATFYYETADYFQALRNWEQALKIKKSKLGEEFHGIYDDYNNIGTSYYYLDQFDQAKVNLNNAIIIGQKQEGNNTPAIALTKNTLALIYKYAHQYTLAQKESTEAAQLITHHTSQNKTLSYNGALAKIYQTQSQIYEGLGDLKEAEIKVAASLEINQAMSQGAPHIEVIKNHGQFVTVYLKQKKYKECLHHAKLGLDMLITLFPKQPNSELLIMCRFNFAVASYFADNIAEAKYFFALTIESINKDFFHEGKSFLTECYSYLIKIYTDEGNYIDAHQCIINWNTLITNEEYSDVRFGTLFTIADFYHRKNNLNDAIRFMQKLISLCQKNNRTEFLYELFFKLAQIYQHKGQYLRGSNRSELAAIEYQQAYINYNLAYSLVNQRKINEKELTSEIETCWACVAVYSTPAIKPILTKALQFNLHLVKKYKQYIEARGLPPADSYLNIKFKKEEALRLYLEKILEIANSAINSNTDTLLVKIPVSILNDLAPEACSITSTTDTHTLDEEDNTLSDLANFPASQLLEEKTEIPEAKPLLSTQIKEDAASKLALASLGVARAIEKITAPVLDLKYLGMLTFGWLTHAVATGDELLVRRILKLAPNLAQQHDNLGNGLLVYAVNGGHISIINLLLNPKFQTDINQVNAAGDTVLMIAIERNVAIDLLLALLQGKPDHRIVNQKGENTLAIAQRLKHQEIILELNEYIQCYSTARSLPTVRLALTFGVFNSMRKEAPMKEEPKHNAAQETKKLSHAIVVKV